MLFASSGSLQSTKNPLSFTGTRSRSTHNLHIATTSGIIYCPGSDRKLRATKKFQRAVASALAADTDAVEMPETQPNMLFAAAMPKQEIGALAFLEVYKD